MYEVAILAAHNCVLAYIYSSTYDLYRCHCYANSGVIKYNYFGQRQHLATAAFHCICGCLGETQQRPDK